MLTTNTTNGVTNIEHSELGVVAKVWRQGNYQVKLAIGPDEWVRSEWATREAAESVAIRHTESL